MMKENATSEACSLDFFATSLAALAEGNSDPKIVLEDAIAVMGIDRDTLLSRQAERCGYRGQPEQFEQTLIAAISQQLFELKSCHLTAADRKKRLLIDQL